MVYPIASTQCFKPPSKKFSQYLSTGNQQSMKLTHLFPMFPFEPPENIRKQKVLLGDKKGTLGRNG